MSAWIWVLIPLVAIIGGYIIDYQKNKLKWQNQTSSNESELEELRGMVNQMARRIENLEAIAANEPSDFSSARKNDFHKIEIDPYESHAEENRKNVEQMAKKQGNKS
ncbi:hypothetical protein DYD21_02970 [Rhodohalobacter sp. SW132]|uniref:hypothetical protein n=1 Tax=Rhodohalobacter sp. SW132 TaxID=2293433 RepID=UPI000E279CEA|nr:hypothetical protein [Rhodohalobacter sp. SW132]REL38931.1 hypothetical protein DYD21_02970 [Rhodohalobacter sp. SW132]